MSDPDHLIFIFTPEELLAAVRSIAAGSSVPDDLRSLLARLGLVANGQLTAYGRQLHKFAFILHDDAAVEREVVRLLRTLLPVQVLEQELAGYGVVPEDGVVELLNLHGALPLESPISAVRRFLRWANGAGLLVYSQKNKTVRVPALEDGSEEGSPPPAGVVSPRTPFTNIIRLRRALRRLKGTVWWVDPYFHSRGLEEMVTNLDFPHISEVRILSSNKASVMTESAGRDFDAFRAESELKGTVAQWRFDPSRDWHDQWLFGDQEGYNMPPSELIFAGQKFSEYRPGAERPPLDEWWARARSWRG
jgi:hypothetical protein